MSFEGSRATIIKNLSGNSAFVDSSGYLYAQVAGTSLTVDISGDPVNVSGSTVAIWGESGRNPVYLTNQSGNVAAIAVNYANTDTLLASTFGAGLVTNDILFALDGTAGRYNRVRVTESGTTASQGGVRFRVLTDTTQGGSNLRTAGIIAISDASGGAALSTSASCIHGIVIKNVSGTVQGALHIGSSGNPPWISGGFVLELNESREFKVHNPAFVRVFARVSGILTSWCGTDF